MTATRAVSKSTVPTSTLAAKLMIESMLGELSVEHRLTCKKSSVVGVTYRRPLNQEMLIAAEERHGREAVRLRSVCNNLEPLAHEKMVFSADKMLGGLKSLRFHPSSGKRSNAAKKIDILSRRMIRLFDLGATRKRM
ncbi:MAG: hypothetical protein NTZ35_02945 [Ignavibacteriales bacterium]|nr:hypothetical protein [Ignavibacteriales bacterium]